MQSAFYLGKRLCLDGRGRLMGFSRAVVITGQGIVSPIGIGCDAFWDSLTSGRSGVRPLQAFDPGPLPVRFGAELIDFDPRQHVRPRKALKVMCRELQTAFAAASLAADQAGLAPGVTSPERIGTVFGSEMFYGEVEEFIDLHRACQVEGKFVYERYGEQFMNHIHPLWMLKNLPNMAACHVAIAQDARGPNNSIVAGDVSGMLALIEAVRVIDRGSADAMFVGATGSRVGLTGWMYRGNDNLSHYQGAPAQASRPFDAHRDGMVNGEGAAALVLESREHAVRRGAPILAELTGYATAMASGHKRAQMGDILKRVLRNLADHDRISKSVGHVNAHGLSTIADDRREAQSIRDVLGDTPVTALKSYFGNLGSASSLVELIGSVLAIGNNAVPPTLNYQHTDPECPVNVVRNEPLTGHPSQSFVKLSFSPTGQTAAIVVRGH